MAADDTALGRLSAYAPDHEVIHERVGQDVVSRRNGRLANRGEPEQAIHARQATSEAAGETERILRAAAIALHQFPGPAGQLLQREILSYLQFRHHSADRRALVPRIVADLLDEPVVSTGPDYGAEASSRPDSSDASPPQMMSSGGADELSYPFER